MKFKVHVNGFRCERSPPVRGAWIEMWCARSMLYCCVSPPVRGAWIEIRKPAIVPHAQAVAPREGGVD